MRRLFIMCSLFAVFLQPWVVIAQEVEHNGHGPGTPADAETTDQVIAFLDIFVEKWNAQDPTVVNVANESGLTFFYTDSYNEAVNNVVTGRFAPIQLYEVRDVLVHADGAVSAEIVYSGFDLHWDNLWQERWYLFPDGAGGYILNDAQFSWPGEPVRVPDEMTVSTATLSLSNTGLQMDTATVEEADVLVLEVINLEGANWTTTGVYVLPEGVEPLDAQAQIVAHQRGGNQGPFPFDVITITPVEPGTTRHNTFLIDPGVTYLVQQWSLDSEGQNPALLEGEQFVTTFSVVPMPIATPN